MPSHLEKHDAIRQAAIAVNPKITDLKMGCRGFYDSGSLVVLGSSGMWHMVDDETWGASSKPPSKIIGRDLTFADILLAIEKKIQEQWLDSPNPGDSIGNFQPHLEKLAIDLLRKWDLTKSFEEQGDEVVNFIHELLEKKV